MPATSDIADTLTLDRWLELKRHPATLTGPVRAIAVLVRRSTPAELQLTYRLDGDIRRISVPPSRTPRIAAQLWQHTCFEAFIAIDPRSDYHEFNFAPSGEWAVYAFSGYRNGPLIPIANETMHPNIQLRSTDSRLELDARIRLDAVSTILPHAALRVALSAVIEAGDGFSYWALRHPADKPDFHNPDGFALLPNPPSPEL